MERHAYSGSLADRCPGFDYRPNTHLPGHEPVRLRDGRSSEERRHRMVMTAKIPLVPDEASPLSSEGRSLDLLELIVATRTVAGALGMAGSRDSALRQVSRLWIEAHGEEASRVLATLLRQPLNLEDLARASYSADERPILRWESDLIRWIFEARAEELRDREMAILRRTLGFDGQPQPLAEVARAAGLT